MNIIVKFIKILRKQCLCNGCKENATHFMHKKYGLCEYHYKEFLEIGYRLGGYEKQLRDLEENVEVYHER